MLQFFVQCAECKSTLELGPNEVLKTKIEMPNGKSIWLTYFDCPKCGHRHFAQIDDVRTQMLLSDLTKVLAATAKAKKQGHSVKKQSAKYHRINRDLSAIRNDLEKEYSGAVVCLPDRQMPYELEFTKQNTFDVTTNHDAWHAVEIN